MTSSIDLARLRELATAALIKSAAHRAATNGGDDV